MREGRKKKGKNTGIRSLQNKRRLSMEIQEEDFLDNGSLSGEVQDELYEHHRFTADKGQEPLRIDKFLVQFIQNATRNRVQNAIRAQNVLVNDAPVKPNYKVRPGDVIRVVWERIARTGEIPDASDDVERLDVSHDPLERLGELRASFGSCEDLVSLDDDQMRDMIASRYA